MLMSLYQCSMVIRILHSLRRMLVLILPSFSVFFFVIHKVLLIVSFVVSSYSHKSSPEGVSSGNTRYFHKLNSTSTL